MHTHVCNAAETAYSIMRVTKTGNVIKTPKMKTHGLTKVTHMFLANSKTQMKIRQGMLGSVHMRM